MIFNMNGRLKSTLKGAFLLSVGALLVAILTNTYVDAMVMIVGVQIIAWVILNKVNELYGQVDAFKKLGGPELMHQLKNSDDPREVIEGFIRPKRKVKKTEEEEEEDVAYQDVEEDIMYQ